MKSCTIRKQPETHVLDGLQLEVDAFDLLFGQVFAPAPVCSLICEVAQVVVVVGKAVGQREVGQDRFVVDGICLDFVKDLHSVGQRFGYVGEEGVHLFGRFHPLLFGSTACVWGR